jgi:pyridoxal phosphate enzyme (YggS family)
VSGVAENIERIRERIERAALKAGRRSDEIKLVAVSKTIDAERVREAVEAGATAFGENYVQEAREKISLVGRQVAWHFIGHLQTNKAKHAVQLFDMVHSVDSVALAREMERHGEKRGRCVDVLVQVNIRGEETKFGANEEGLMELIAQVSGLEHLRLRGLMTMPPYFGDPEEARPYFTALRELRDKIRRERKDESFLAELSMGMTGDFEVAIEEGATMVRIGTAIFGERRY